jgi:hypothetical protein
VLLLQFLHLATRMLQGRLKGQSLDQDRLSCFQGDEGMRHALATAEQESWPVLGIVVAHPALQIDMANGQIRRLSSFGSLSVMPFWP